jgi:hypothetical protein
MSIEYARAMQKVRELEAAQFRNARRAQRQQRNG